ncbi:hypothetical protein BGW80DRAFT_1169461 [Lactifluus volemus]|nr:hypothetical protein BGW80DRAFT_1169461 [Lactifluus volemus]
MSYPGPPPGIPGVDQSYVDNARAHAILASVTFLVVLPLGVLIPRYFRTFTTKWWIAHWVFNGFVAFPLIIASWVKAVKASGTGGPLDHHQKIGTIIFCLYIIQIIIGAFVHFVRIPFPLILHRPLSNYVHALLGLTIIAMSAYQVCSHGLFVEWLFQTGNQPPITLSEKHAWLALVIVSHVQGYLYLGH